MAKFDLKGILSQESRKEMDLPEQRIVYRSPEDLLPDKENFYNTEDIADLKESIRSLGLLQVKMYDKAKALELLGRHLGMFKDKVEVSGLEEEKKKLDDILQQIRGDE